MWEYSFFYFLALSLFTWDFFCMLVEILKLKTNLLSIFVEIKMMRVL